MHNTLAVWSGDLMGLAMLFFALLGVGCVQAAIAMAVMYGMNKLIPEKLTQTTYGEFDFDHFQRPAFNVFVTRMIIIFVGVTLVLHMLEYLIVYRDIIRHWGLATLVLFALETGALTAGLYFMFRLDRLRLAMIIGVSAFVYLLFFAFMRWCQLLI